MATGIVTWSTTAASNATADSNINWAEGQAPSSVNDSARAMMASAAKWRDDTNGSITTGGTSTAYTVTSNQSFASLSAMGNAVIAFVPHATNGASPTLAVDGLTAKKIRFTTGADIQDGVLIAGTPYTVTYFASVGEFILHDLGGALWMCPIGAAFDYWGATAPTAHFAFPSGQAVSRTTYSTLFSLMGTTHGAGDGSTTFNLPDKRGRVSISKDNMNGSAAGRVTGGGAGIDGTLLGAAGGAQTVTLAQVHLPNVAPAFTGINGGIVVNSTNNGVAINAGTSFSFGAGGLGALTGNLANPLQSTGTFTPSGTVGSINPSGASPFSAVQPGIVTNYIMRVL